MSLGSIAVVSQKDVSTLWASFHDGAFVSQIIGVKVDGKQSLIQDQWNDAYNGVPLKRIFLENVRDFIFERTATYMST